MCQEHQAPQSQIDSFTTELLRAFKMLTYTAERFPDLFDHRASQDWGSTNTFQAGAWRNGWLFPSCTHSRLYPAILPFGVCKKCSAYMFPSIHFQGRDEWTDCTCTCGISTIQSHWWWSFCRVIQTSSKRLASAHTQASLSCELSVLVQSQTSC